MTTSKERIGRIEPPLTDEQRARMRQSLDDYQYIGRHYDELAEKYPDQWIAVHKGEVILTGTDVPAFSRQLRELGWIERGVRVRYLDPNDKDGFVMVTHPQ